MRIHTKYQKDAEKLAEAFEECHIERTPGGNVYLVIDKVKRLKA